MSDSDATVLSQPQDSHAADPQMVQYAPVPRAQQLVDGVVVPELEVRIVHQLRDARPRLLGAPLVVDAVLQLRQRVLRGLAVSVPAASCPSQTLAPDHNTLDEQPRAGHNS